MKLLLILALLGTVGCAATMRTPLSPSDHAPPPAGPKLTLTVENVNLDAQGLYFAPNVIPALSPSFAPPAPSVPVPMAPETPMEPAMASPIVPSVPSDPREGDYRLAALRAKARQGDRGAQSELRLRRIAW